MELTGAVLRRSLPSASPAAARGRMRRRAPARVACVGGGRFAEEGHVRYYEAAAPRRKTVEAVARDLAKLRSMGLVAGDAAKEKVLSEATDLLLQELNQMKEEEYKMKKAQKEEEAAMKALKKQQKEAKKAAAIAMMNCEDESSESSESDCEDEPAMNFEQGMVISAAVPEAVASCTSSVCTSDSFRQATRRRRRRRAAPAAAAAGGAVPVGDGETLEALLRRGVTSVTGQARCKRCGARKPVAYDLEAKFRPLRDYVVANRHNMNDRAPEAWMFPSLPDCGACGHKGGREEGVQEFGQLKSGGGLVVQGRRFRGQNAKNLAPAPPFSSFLPDGVAEAARRRCGCGGLPVDGAAAVAARSTGLRLRWRGGRAVLSPLPLSSPAPGLGVGGGMAAAKAPLRVAALVVAIFMPATAAAPASTGAVK